MIKISKCYDCELSYGSDAWIEAVVPNDIWLKISPTNDEGGILCINCMARRCADLGLKDVSIKITAGPFKTDMKSTFTKFVISDKPNIKFLLSEEDNKIFNQNGNQFINNDIPTKSS